MTAPQLIAIWRTRANRARSKATAIARSDNPEEFEDLIAPDAHWHSIAEHIDQCAEELEAQK